MSLRKQLLVICSSAILAVSWAGLVRAQSVNGYPNKPIKIVVPFPPGGATDIIARVIAQKLTEQMGQSVIVENKAGANGNIAHEFVARAQPDGYTLLYNTSSIALSPALYKKLAYDVRTDFAPVILTSAVPLLLSVNPAVPANNIKEFIALLRAKPNALSYGSAGIGNITHLGSFLSGTGDRVRLGPYLVTAGAGSPDAQFDQCGADGLDEPAQRTAPLHQGQEKYRRIDRRNR